MPSATEQIPQDAPPLLTEGNDFLEAGGFEELSDSTYLNDWDKFSEGVDEKYTLAESRQISDRLKRKRQEVVDPTAIHRSFRDRVKLVEKFYTSIFQRSTLEGATPDLEIASHLIEKEISGREESSGETNVADKSLLLSLYTDLSRYGDRETQIFYEGKSAALAGSIITDETIPWHNEHKIWAAMIAQDITFARLRRTWVESGDEHYEQYEAAMKDSINLFLTAYRSAKDYIGFSTTQGFFLEWAALINYRQHLLSMDNEEAMFYDIRSTTLRQDKGSNPGLGPGGDKLKDNFDLEILRYDKNDPLRIKSISPIQLKSSSIEHKGEPNRYRAPITLVELQSDPQIVFQGIAALAKVYGRIEDAVYRPIEPGDRKKIEAMQIAFSEVNPEDAPQVR